MNQRFFSDDWKDDSLLKFPKIENSIKEGSNRHAKIHNCLLNDIKLRQQADLNKRIASFDRNINLHILLKSNQKYMSLKRNKKSISTFLDKSMVNKIVKNVSRTSKILNYDYSKGNILNF